MKNELLNIADYLESLEVRLATLEARTIELESKVSELEARPETPIETIENIEEQPEADVVQQIDEQLEQDMKIATLEARLIELECKDAATTSVVPPISDLRHAISLGDRFLFQRELFNQNGELMQKTLETLEKKNNLDEALVYLDKHFDWNKESSTYQLFLSLLKRRF